MSQKTRHLWWHGGEGGAMYHGVDVVLTQRPHLAGVREFVEIEYRPGAHRAQLRLPHQRQRVQMSTDERVACDRALDAMARAARAVFAKDAA